MVRNIAIIPARSGSKRVKDKNIRMFGGKPLLAWCVTHALESGLFDKVYVSTDSDKYADIARQYGAWVPFLRDAHADDFSGVGQVVVYELTRIEKFLGCSFDNVGLLQATCPLCPSTVIKEVYDDFIQQSADTMGTCFPFSYGNPWWAFRPTENHEADFLLTSPVKSRSQDHCQLYCPTGAICFAKTSTFKNSPTFYGGGHKFHPIAWKHGFDIDEEEDIAMGEVLLKMSSSGVDEHDRILI